MGSLFRAFLALPLCWSVFNAHAVTAVAFGETTGKFGYAVNQPDKAAASRAAIEDCQKRGGGNDCKVFKVSNEVGYGALYAACAGSNCGFVSAMTGRKTRDAAHSETAQDCRTYYQVPSCIPLAEWQETSGDSNIVTTDQRSISTITPLRSGEKMQSPAPGTAPRAAQPSGAESPAIVLLEQQASSGNAKAQYILGLCYGGLFKDKSKQSYWFDQAYKNGLKDPAFLDSYAFALMDSNDAKKGNDMLNEAIDHGSAGAAAFLELVFRKRIVDAYASGGDKKEVASLKKEADYYKALSKQFEKKEKPQPAAVSKCMEGNTPSEQDVMAALKPESSRASADARRR